MTNLIAGTFDKLADSDRKAKRGVKKTALSKQIAAIKLSIKALEHERRRLHAAGEYAWQSGIRPDVIDDKDVQGIQFSFAEDGHKGYVQYTEAIGEMDDMLEALQDADATLLTQPALFEETE